MRATSIGVRLMVSFRARVRGSGFGSGSGLGMFRVQGLEQALDWQIPGHCPCLLAISQAAPSV